MPSDYELTISRYQTFLRDVLDPSVFPASTPLRTLAAQLSDPASAVMAPKDATKLSFQPVETGWVWGPKWSSAWFKVSGTVPEAWRNESVVVRFSSGTEAMFWQETGGAWVPVRGLDVNRDVIPIDGSSTADGEFNLLIEAACNHPFGVLGFEWDPAEVHTRWQSATPGRLERSELAIFDHQAWELRHHYAFALGLLKELPELSSRAQGLVGSLRRATNAILTAARKDSPATNDIRGPILTVARDSISKALAELHIALSSPAAGSAPHCVAIGHAHIDTAWLWPIRETKRKCLRSWSNQLRLMEQFPEYHFLCSQAQQYQWVEEASPELFTQLAARVKEGRWEPGGGMWVEPDANCPSGESLVRQILHGTRYWTEKFGDAAPQSFLYLPDTFGFPATLPQIMAQGGLTTFITNKMIWNRSNVFPHTHFEWRGLDGTSVLGHNTPGHDYNAVNTPKELRRGEDNHRTKTTAPAAFLQPFGYGDGGGGPTDWSIRYAEYSANCEGLPRVTFGRADAFCKDLHALHARTAGTPEALPVWDGELYLEMHRGTLTSQAWIKEANRRAEEDLRFAELLLASAPEESAQGTPTAAPTDRSAAVAKLDKAWKTLLLQQFHDILPGSSIAWVYEDSRRDFFRIQKITSALVERGTSRWLAGLSTQGMTSPLGVFNQCSVNRSGVLELEGGDLCFARNVPALGVAITDRSLPHGCVPAQIDDRLESEGILILSNGIIRVEIDELGQIVSLARIGSDGTHEPVEVVALRSSPDGEVADPLNQLVLYEDVPHMWDAWDVDPTYVQKGIRCDLPCDAIEIVCEESLRVAVRFSRALGANSRIEQTISLDAASPRVDIHNKVHWAEHRHFLRALFPTAIRAPHATFDIQFGRIERSTHANTTWDAAKFEVCAHQWMDLSQRGLGLAVLNDGKYGHSCRNGIMGLSLLRAPKHPDPTADLGEHEFTYSLMPHHGDWRSAGVDREGEALNTPLAGYVLNAGEPGTLGHSWSPFRLRTTDLCGVTISAIKPCEDGDGFILRGWECHGGHGALAIDWNLPVKSVEVVDLLERPAPLTECMHEDRTTTLVLRPFGLFSLRVCTA